MQHYLSQHAQRHINSGHQSAERRSHIRVKRRSGETQHKQSPVLRKVHRLKHTHNICMIMNEYLCMIMNEWCVCVCVCTWSSNIWQQSGVKCCNVASVLLRIFNRLHWTACRALDSASSLSPSTCSLEAGWAARWGCGPWGSPSPFLTWANRHTF